MTMKAELECGTASVCIRRKPTFWLKLAAIAWCCIVTALQAAESRPPNFVFILIDDLGWADIGCFGGTFYKTPNLDGLAKQGMKFTAAYAACPVCSPTRASILTGKYPARLHLTDWLPGRGDGPSQQLLRPDFLRQLALAESTLAEALKPAGYVSASIGKWHLGGNGFGPEDQGFDLNVAGNDAGSPASYFHPYRSGNRRMLSLDEGKPGEYLTDRLTDEAEKFIERHQAKPFFLYLAHYAVHVPLAAKSELIARYQNAAQPGQIHTNAVYAAMIQSVDESVGRVLKKLEQLKLDDRTIIFFMSDNGGLSVKAGPNTPATSNAPLREGKGYLYEGGIREPLIVRWPGAARAGSVCDTPVSSIDFFPTILEMAEIKSNRPVDGVSLVPLLKQTGGFKREALYWHYPHYAPQGGKPGGIIRQGDYKLIEFYEDGHLELYDLKQDMGEKVNLAEKMPDKALQLEMKLDAWRRDVKAQMMNPNPNYSPAAKAAN